MLQSELCIMHEYDMVSHVRDTSVTWKDANRSDASPKKCYKYVEMAPKHSIASWCWPNTCPFKDNIDSNPAQLAARKSCEMHMNILQRNMIHNQIQIHGALVNVADLRSQM